MLLRYIYGVYRNQYLLTVVRVLFLILVSGRGVCAQQTHTVQDDHYATYPQVNASGDDEARIARGEYLTKAGDCIACHTTKDGEAFAGGLPLETPFGTFYSPNITPNREHGIGGWTDNEFIQAMRHGVAPDGSSYYPAFPYVYYNRVNDDDILAIKAYLDHIPAVDKPNIQHEVPFPFNIRALQWVWKLFFFFPEMGEFAYDVDRSDVWNRGRYLVEGLAHCGMCHTPMNFVGVAQNRLAFTGNMVDGWYAPNITGSNLLKVQEQDLVHMFVSDEKPGGRGQVQGPMREVNHDSLIYLDQQDLGAIAHYIKSTVQIRPDDKPVVVSGDRLSVGKQIYQPYCSSCHNVGSAGAPKIGDAIAWQTRMTEGRDTLYYNAIHGKGVMSARGLCPDEVACNDEQVSAAVDYILAKSLPQEGVKVASRQKGKKPKQYTMEDGRDIFINTCATCHVHGNLEAPRLGYPKDWTGRLDKSFDVMITGVLEGSASEDASNSDVNQTGCILVKGGCEACNDAEVIAAIKYLVHSVVPEGKDFSKW